MITITVTATKGVLEIENTADGSACSIGGHKFDQYSRYQEGQEKFPDGEYESITFEASAFKGAYTPRQILSAIPKEEKGQKANSGASK